MRHALPTVDLAELFDDRRNFVELFRFDGDVSVAGFVRRLLRRFHEPFRRPERRFGLADRQIEIDVALKLLRGSVLFKRFQLGEQLFEPFFRRPAVAVGKAEPAGVALAVTGKEVLEIHGETEQHRTVRRSLAVEFRFEIMRAGPVIADLLQSRGVGADDVVILVFLIIRKLVRFGDAVEDAADIVQIFRRRQIGRVTHLAGQRRQPGHVRIGARDFEQGPGDFAGVGPGVDHAADVVARRDCRRIVAQHFEEEREPLVTVAALGRRHEILERADPCFGGGGKLRCRGRRGRRFREVVCGDFGA